MKKLPKAAKLGMQYHIHDLIGADRLERFVLIQHVFVEKKNLMIALCFYQLVIFSLYCLLFRVW